MEGCPESLRGEVWQGGGDQLDSVSLVADAFPKLINLLIITPCGAKKNIVVSTTYLDRNCRCGLFSCRSFSKTN